MAQHIGGLDQALEKLRTLAKPRIVKKIVRKAARQGMNLVRDAARANAKAIDDPETSEKIWKNITTSAGKTSNSDEIKMRVGIKGGASYSNSNFSAPSGGDTRYWRFLELGTSEIPAVPFMRPALANNVDRVTSKFVEVFNDEVNKELAKL